MRICVINAIAPPASGSRSERTLHLSRALVEAGHSVTVVGAHLPTGFAPVDRATDGLMEAAGVETIRLAPGWPARFKYRKGRGSRVSGALAEFAWPDRWAGFGLRAGRWLVRHAERFDLVISSAFPWSDLLPGLTLGGAGPKWIVDYGDPWSLANVRGTWRRTPEYRVERGILRACGGVVVTTEPTRDLFRHHFGLEEERLLVLPAGVEPVPLPRPKPGSPLTILHAGAVYGPRLSPVPFLEAFASWRKSSGRPARLVWCGPIDDPDTLAAVRDYADEYRPYVGQDELGDLEGTSHAALVLGNYGGQQIPAKVWRALGRNRPQFIVVEAEDDPMCRLPELRSSAIFTWGGAPAIAGALERLAALVAEWDFTPGRLAHEAAGLTWDSKASRLTEFAQGLRPAVVATGFRRSAAPGPAFLVAACTVLGLRPFTRLMAGSS